MEEANRTNYEKEHPSHAPEKEFYAQATRRLDEALRSIVEIEERMAHNMSRGSERR